MTGSETTVRRPAVAGMFYPGDRQTLEQAVDGFLAAAPAWAGPRPKALVLPHAGYTYSGSIAAAGYASLTAHRASVRRVVLLGPAHRVALGGVALPAAAAFRTPLGAVRIDQMGAAAAVAAGAVTDDYPHRDEHSLEVHLPFIQRAVGDVPVLPMAVGESRPEKVAAVLEAVWGDSGTVVIVSTDLSHYLTHDRAQRADAATAAAIVARDWRALQATDACGYFPLRGLLAVAERREMTVRQLDLRTSGDTSGDRARVVGYGAFALFERPDSDSGLPAEDQRAAIDLAEAAIRDALLGKPPAPFDHSSVPGGLRAPGASFVTLERGARLLGCRGSIEARRPLADDIAWNAVLTAFKDPRFRPIGPAEFQEMSIKISVLSQPAATGWTSLEEAVAGLRPGVDGLLLTDREARATFLPSVWSQLPGPQDFLDALWEKAGLVPRTWGAGTSLLRYTTQEFAGYGPREL